jgi:hypothetical protein
MSYVRLVPLALAVLLSACGGGSGGGGAPPAAATTGDVMVGIHDAAGDFLTYAVDVTSIRLQRANGDGVETVPLTTRIDFAQLAELTEFFTVATVPSGTYTRVVMSLDFTNSQIVVQDDTGTAIPVLPVDQQGNAVTTMQVTIDLPDSEHVVVARGVPAAVTLDFDLAASNTVDTTTNPDSVVVQPFLAATPQIDVDREHRVRGVLAAVDETASTVTLKVRPFHVAQGEFGRLTFNTNDQTLWEIDGVNYTGADGLGVLAGKAENTPVVAQGMVADARLTATTVLAGSSVPWAGATVLTGVVTARSADTLMVRGAQVDFATGTHSFFSAFTLLVGDDTNVTALGVDSGTLDKNSISVGQRVVAFGELSGSTTLDATAGHVRMEVTSLGGVVVQADPLVVNLFALGGVRLGVFDFTGTGTAPANDADPHRYEIDTGALDLSNVVANDIVRVRGLVNGFGLAPPDFLARTVIDVDTAAMGALFGASWILQGGTALPFDSVAADRIDVDLRDARFRLTLFDVQAAANTQGHLALVAPPTGRGIYLVVLRGSREMHLFGNFASLTTELSRQLTAGNLLTQIGAAGRYNAAAVELTTPQASFEFTTP